MREWSQRAVEVGLRGHKAAILEVIASRNIGLENISALTGVREDIWSKFFYAEYVFDEENMKEFLFRLGMSEFESGRIMDIWARDMIFMRKCYDRDDFCAIS